MQISSSTKAGYPRIYVGGAVDSLLRYLSLHHKDILASMHTIGFPQIFYLLKSPQISQIPTDFLPFKVTQISQMTQIFLLEICVSLSHRFHRFTQIFLFGYLGNFPFDYGKKESV